MEENKKKKFFIASIIVVAVFVIGALFYTGIIDLNKPEEEQIIVVPEVEPELPKQTERQLWLDNKAINQDYQGEVVFESGIINKSFVQAKDVYDESGNLYHFYTERGSLVTNPQGYTGNDVYIWTNWKDMSYDYNILGGSVFMDYRNNWSDQNIIIYGHHFSEGGGNDPERNKAFTPLEKLLKNENVDDYKKVKLILDNETRYYDLAYVYKFDINDDFYYDKCQYYRTNYNYDEFEDKIQNDYYENYINAMEQVKLFDTGVKLTTDDNTLTLQTCISGLAGSVFEICVYKETNIELFD